MIYTVAVFLKWQSLMGYNTYAKVILAHVSKKFHFGEVTRTQVGSKLCNPLSYDLPFEDFFEML